MPTYQVVLKTGAWFYKTVEAEDEEAAIEVAYDDVPQLCAQCTGWGDDSATLELGEEWEVDTVEVPS